MSDDEHNRQVITKNTKDGPKDIQTDLEAEGLTVKLGLISVVKYSKAKNREKGLSMTPVVHAVAGLSLHKYNVRPADSGKTARRFDWQCRSGQDGSRCTFPAAIIDVFG
jgi:hypothetical protein